MIASESVALDAIGFKLERDVAPGEAVFVDLEGNLHTKSCSENSQLNPCIFEYVYFARPDSIMDNVSVYKSRLRMGEKLAEKINRESQGKNIDVVIPIPDTSRTGDQRPLRDPKPSAECRRSAQGEGDRHFAALHHQHPAQRL